MSLPEESDPDFTDISQNNYVRVFNTVSKVGYSDGITDGRESVFQKGFDTGYSEGLLTGFELTKYKAFFKALDRTAKSNEFGPESEAFEKLNIPDATDKHHFQMLQHPDSTVAEISKQQHDYVNEQKQIFRKEMPIVSNLLSE